MQGRRRRTPRGRRRRGHAIRGDTLRLAARAARRGDQRAARCRRRRGRTHRSPGEPSLEGATCCAVRARLSERLTRAIQGVAEIKAVTRRGRQWRTVSAACSIRRRDVRTRGPMTPTSPRSSHRTVYCRDTVSESDRSWTGRQVVIAERAPHGRILKRKDHQTARPFAVDAERLTLVGHREAEPNVQVDRRIVRIVDPELRSRRATVAAPGQHRRDYHGHRDAPALVRTGQPTRRRPRRRSRPVRVRRRPHRTDRLATSATYMTRSSARAEDRARLLQYPLGRACVDLNGAVKCVGRFGQHAQTDVSVLQALVRANPSNLHADRSVSWAPPTLRIYD